MTDHPQRHVYVQEGFLGLEDCLTLRELAGRFRDPAGNYQAIYPPDITAMGTPAERSVFDSTAERVAERIREVYADPGVELETKILVMMRTGSEHTPHADAEYEAQPGVWQPNHTPARTHAGLLYLTTDGEDHEGGVLHVLDREVRCEPGRLAMFPATREYVHRVTPITAGERVSMSVWTRRRA